MKFQFIEKNRLEFPVVKMCRIMKVSESGFYRWCKPSLSKRKIENILLRNKISKLFQEHKGRVGSPSLTAELRLDERFSFISRARVARHMKALGLQCRTVKKYVVTMDSKHNEPIAQNLLNRKFKVASANQVWVSDITYLKVNNKWHYLSVFIDLYSRMVVGWDLSNSLETSSTLRALSKAIKYRNPQKRLMIHSDRGIRYASKEFRNKLKSHDFIQSMSRKGNCWDNAVAESFFHTLKGQCIRGEHFKNIDEARVKLFEYIEIYYNRRRLHSSNNWQSPANFENRNMMQIAA